MRRIVSTVHRVMRLRRSKGPVPWTGAILALAVFLPGCDSIVTDHVELLTGVEACNAGAQSPGAEVLLLPDAEFGTRFDGLGPVMWPVGYTAVRRADGQVEVKNREGGLVATTGKHYKFSNVPGQSEAAARVINAVGAVPVCDAYPWDFVDCAAVADGTGDPAEAGYCRLGPSYDLAAVKASFEEKCAEPRAIEGETCARIDIGRMRGEGATLTVPTTGMHRHPDRAAVVCEQVASANLDDAGVPLGFDTVIIEGKNNKLLAECAVDKSPPP